MRGITVRSFLPLLFSGRRSPPRPPSEFASAVAREFANFAIGPGTETESARAAIGDAQPVVLELGSVRLRDFSEFRRQRHPGLRALCVSMAPTISTSPSTQSRCRVAGGRDRASVRDRLAVCEPRTCVSCRSTIISPISTCWWMSSTARSTSSAFVKAAGWRWSMPRAFPPRSADWCLLAPRSICRRQLEAFRSGAQHPDGRLQGTRRSRPWSDSGASCLRQLWSRARGS